MILDRFISVVNDVQNITKVLSSFQEGHVFALPGKRVVEIVTRKTPQELWVSLKDAGNMPVCNGDIDKVGYTLTPTGFILYLDVLSETLQVEWNALFDIND